MRLRIAIKNVFRFVCLLLAKYQLDFVYSVKKNLGVSMVVVKTLLIVRV